MDSDLETERRTLRYIIMFFLGVATLVLPVILAPQHRSISIAVMMLFPSLAYTSLLTAASTGTRNARRVHRILGACLAFVYYLCFVWSVPDTLEPAVFGFLGIFVCLMIDAWSPSCTGKPLSLSEIIGGSSGRSSVVSLRSGVLPEGLKLESLTGDISGTPTTEESFTLNIFDQNGKLSVVTYKVTLGEKRKTSGIDDKQRHSLAFMAVSACLLLVDTFVNNGRRRRPGAMAVDPK